MVPRVMLKYKAAGSFSPWVEGSDKNANGLCWAELVAQSLGAGWGADGGHRRGSWGRAATPQGDWALGESLTFVILFALGSLYPQIADLLVSDAE